MFDFSKIDVPLSAHGHDRPEDGLCLMEMVAFFEGEPHSDRPECACAVLGDLGRFINDQMPDHLRTELLRPLVPRLVGTVSDDHVGVRNTAMLMELAHGLMPRALAARGFLSEADRLAWTTTPKQVEHACAAIEERLAMITEPMEREWEALMPATHTVVVSAPILDTLGDPTGYSGVSTMSLILKAKAELAKLGGYDHVIDALGYSNGPFSIVKKKQVAKSKAALFKLERTLLPYRALLGMMHEARNMANDPEPGDCHHMLHHVAWLLDDGGEGYWRAVTNVLIAGIEAGPQGMFGPDSGERYAALQVVTGRSPALVS